MTILRATAAVFAFECRRALGWRRGLLVLALASFPAAILWLIRREGGQLNRQEAWPLALFVLIPELVCLLGLLLWVTPMIQTEVEGKTWPHLAVRPAGKLSILLGKYAAGVFWTVLTAWLALALAMWVVWPLPDATRVTRVLAALAVLSSMTYGALFSLFGVVFLRRGMIFAVGYTLVEFLVRLIPAIIRQLTVQYHLQSLLVAWMHWEEVNRRMGPFFGVTTPAESIATLVGYTVFLLGVTAAILRRRQLVTAVETA
jgi:ABC-type transport system involved in multi-copper enzyme maturation permease subunit